MMHHTKRGRDFAHGALPTRKARKLGNTDALLMLATCAIDIATDCASDSAESVCSSDSAADHTEGGGNAGSAGRVPRSRTARYARIPAIESGGPIPAGFVRVWVLEMSIDASAPRCISDCIQPLDEHCVQSRRDAMENVVTLCANVGFEWIFGVHALHFAPPLPRVLDGINFVLKSVVVRGGLAVATADEMVMVQQCSTGDDFAECIVLEGDDSLCGCVASVMLNPNPTPDREVVPMYISAAESKAYDMGAIVTPPHAFNIDLAREVHHGWTTVQCDRSTQYMMKFDVHFVPVALEIHNTQ